MVVLFFFISVTTLFGGKIKDVTSVVGVRDNQLIGYGLVVGLKGTGDGTSTFTGQSLANFLKSVNIQIDQNAIKSKNVAAVMLTSTLKSFSKQGDKLDAVVSSIGDAKSLAGGTLLMTPLKGVDGKTYALAQGSVGLGTHTTVGKIPGGATVEKTLSYDIYNKQMATLSVSAGGFKNVLLIQNAINKEFGEGVARATDPRSIKLKKPKDDNMVEFLANVGDLDIQLEKNNKIIIDQRTGTIIAGIDMEVRPVMVTHGGISLKVDDKLLEDGGKLTISNVTKALQRLGATPKDVIAIFEAIKKAGALDANLEII
ncbi:MAG: flagellar basal body P-ring protein FlgI [Campylobacterales bacterium]|nr:flagellar basal body P-ring protein FlgI [Campylobacterales bacterium]